MKIPTKSIWSAAILLAVTSIFATQSDAQTKSIDKVARQSSPAGTWTWQTKTDKGSIVSRISVREKDGKFEGKYKDKNHSIDLKNTSFSTGKFSFEVNPTPKDENKTITFEGQVTLESIKGTKTFKVDGKSKTEKWQAKRYDPLRAIVGKWSLEFKTPDDAELQFPIHIKKKGNDLVIQFIDDQTSTIKNVKLNENNLSFDSQQVYEGEPISVEWELELDGDALDGTLYYAFDKADGEGELAVTGVRIK